MLFIVIVIVGLCSWFCFVLFGVASVSCCFVQVAYFVICVMLSVCFVDILLFCLYVVFVFFIV